MDSINPQDGSYYHLLGGIIVTGKHLRSLPQKPCPVCCRFKARDRDMIKLWWRGKWWWVCKSNIELEDEGCGFAYPITLNKARARALATKRGRYFTTSRNSAVAANIT